MKYTYCTLKRWFNTPILHPLSCWIAGGVNRFGIRFRIGAVHPAPLWQGDTLPLWITPTLSPKRPILSPTARENMLWCMARTAEIVLITLMLLAPSVVVAQEKKKDDGKVLLSADEYIDSTPKYPMIPQDHKARDQFGIIDAKKYMDTITPRITGKTFDPVIRLNPRVPDVEDITPLENPDSYYLLGLKYENGVGGKQRDMLQACNWYDRAVRGNVPKAYARLANCYATGQGRDYSPKLAQSLYEMGMEHNDPKSLCGLGKVLYYTSNDPADIQKGMELCRKGFGRGDSQAGIDLYKIYRDGLKIEPNLYNAKSWLKSALSRGNKTAIKEMATLYKSGYLVKRNLKKSHELLQHLALSGDIASQFELADIYYRNMVDEQGINTALLERAMFWYYTVQSRSLDPYLEEKSAERFQKMARTVSADFVEMVEARYLNWDYQTKQRLQDEKGDEIIEIDRLIPVFDRIRKEKEEAMRLPTDDG